MFTVILIGNSQSYEADGKFITPRGYYGEIKMKTDVGIGQDIMIRSFRTIEKELKNKEIPLDKKWALLHAIHTTADFDMENILRIDDHAVASLYGKFSRGEVRTIITDVTIMGLGATVPGAIACGVLLVGVSLATYRKRPTVMVEVK